ncbi:helix-turn-helix domain-containing protein [Streptomyces sp. NPDC087428]|uniref:helix-turn-helix domain-containing protein n=1 Tax=Streptomyces sp. NPDC087428 TaxID=3365788 RepID=UPI003802B63E
MPSDADPVSSALFGLLELLATEAPPDRFEDLLRTARSEGGDDPESAALLDRARGLALDIHSLFARRHQREAGLAALVDTARELTLPYDLDALLKVITRRARLLLNLDMSWISFHDPAEDCSYVRAADGHASAITVGFRVPGSGGVGNRSRSLSAPFWSPNYLQDDRFPHSGVIDEAVRAEGLHALVSVPLHDGNQVFGSLYVADRNVRHFTPDEITQMSSLGDLVSVAIKKARLLARAREEISELELDSSRALDSSSASRHLRETQSRLTDLVLRGRDLHELAVAAGDALGGTLLIRDVAGRPLAASGAAPELDEGELLKTVLDAHTERAPTRSAAGLWCCPAAAGDEILATLVLAPREPATDHTLQLLRTAAQTTAVLLQVQRSAAAAEGHMRDQLFHELLSTSQYTAGQLAERARRLAVDLTEPHVTVVARPEGGVQGKAVVWASSYAHRLSGLKTTEGGCIVLLLPGTDPGTRARDVSRELSSVLGHPVTVGAAGPITDPVSIILTYREARRCLDALTALGSTGATASPEELGFLGMLLSERPDTASFIGSTIGPVLDYDTQQFTELVRTLEAYFAAGNSPTRAAESLHVHPNTVSRRLERITDLLGAGWQEPVRALEVQLALRLQRARHTLRRTGTAPPQAEAPAT